MPMYRDQMILFKPNENFHHNYGIMMYEMDDIDKLNVKVLQFQKTQQDILENSILKLYQKYTDNVKCNAKLVLFEYFQVKNNTQDSQQHIAMVQQQLNHILRNSYIKLDKFKEIAQQND